MSITIRELIDRHERAQEPRATTVTPYGRATVTARRLASQLAALDERQRADVLSAFLAEVKLMVPALA